MTNPEQTLRERLAEARYYGGWTRARDVHPRFEPEGVREQLYEEVDSYLPAIREWLESEATRAFIINYVMSADNMPADNSPQYDDWFCTEILKALAQSLGGQHD